MSESFIVAVRIRPPSAAEAAHPLHHSIICPISSDTLVFDPPVSSPEWQSPKRSSSSQHAAAGLRRVAAHVPGLPSSARHRDLRYAFDRVFDGSASQTAVYEQTARAVVSRVLDGYNATVFAYGATGCGKTHTMIGTAAQPGVMVQTLRDIFCGIAGRPSVSYQLSLSYLEVYNEQLRDLLSPSSPASSSLQLREERDGSMSIAGLSQHSPCSAEEVFRMLEKGNARRTQSSTDANAQSSRSHAVLQISLKMKEREPDRLSSRIRTAKLSLIDLAGSEVNTQTAHDSSAF
jgi:kinesin family protein 18/19